MVSDFIIQNKDRVFDRQHLGSDYIESFFDNALKTESIRKLNKLSKIEYQNN